MIGSVLWEKERKRCPDGVHDVLDDTRSSVVRLHEGECGACLAADVCSHPCCHDWFLEIGHQLRLVHDDEVASDTEASMGKESTGSSPSANARKASIFRYSRREQMEDECDPLLYDQMSAADQGKKTFACSNHV